MAQNNGVGDGEDGEVYHCDIHGFETESRGQMQQHIDREHPGGAAKDSPEEFLRLGGEVNRDDPFEEHRVMDVKVTSNAADSAVVDINGTQLKIFQHNRHVPVLAEIYVGSEKNPIGSINTARAETVTLGGIDENLAERVDEIRELPVGEIPEALDELSERIHPPRQGVDDAA